MPRLSPHILRHAHTISPLLPLLLPECRTIHSALSELRWLRDHSLETKQPLRPLCERRHRGEPLQYILGTQPFGDLDILCRRGVLIPRPETEELVSKLVTRIAKNRPRGPLRILDLCTGTGCISLYLHTLLPDSHILGIDISPIAVVLARRNLHHNIALGVLPASAAVAIQFQLGNVRNTSELLMSVATKFPGGEVDVVISNPPYISPRGFATETARSVRNYEPRLALVPDAGGEGDEFYPLVGRAAEELGAGVVAVEVGGWEQARRIREVWEGIGAWSEVEVWGDYAGMGRGVVAWKRMKEGGHGQ